MQNFPSVHDTLSGIDGVIRAVGSHSDDLLLVLIGFDGVLAEYQDDPEAVLLSDDRRDLLRRLIQRPNLTLGIVSGRRVEDLRQRVGLGDEVFYIGLHGLEVVGPGFRHVQQRLFDEYRNQLCELASALEPTISAIGGARLENKEGAIALHTRQAGAVDAVWARLHMLNQAADLVNSEAFRALRGNHVLELLPNAGHTKADAIAAIRVLLERRAGRRVFTVYVGEDVVDDDALEAVAGCGVAAVVGRRGGQVHYRLDSTDAVERLVAELTVTRRSGAP